MTHVQQDQQPLNTALAEFVGALEVVFHYDWDYTTMMISGDEPSFLEPGLSVAAESEDWGSRGALLEKYRALVAAMKAAHIDPIFPFPLDRLDGPPVAPPAAWHSST